MKNLLLVVCAFLLMGAGPLQPSVNPVDNGVAPIQQELPGALQKGIVDKNNMFYEKHKVLYSHEDAIQLARQEGVYLFVYFHSERCSPCRKMEQTFNDPAIKRVLQSYVLFCVDIDRERNVFNMYQRCFANYPYWRLDGIPACILVSPFSRRPEKWVKYYRTPSEFYQWLYSR